MAIMNIRASKLAFFFVLWYYIATFKGEYDLMKNIKIVDFNSSINDGQMNTAPSFYTEGMPVEARREIMNLNKQRLVEKLGLTYKNIFIPIQKNMKTADRYADGASYTLTKDDVSDYEDLYNFDVYTDIVKLTPDTRNVAIAFPAADCAVIKAVNTNTNEVVLSHCGGEYIDRYLPMQTIDALGGDEKDIKVYVSPFAYTLTYEDSSKLVWANNPRVWKDCKEYVTENNKESLKINIYKALRKQLIVRRIKEENLYISKYDITESDLFYSNHKSYQDKKYAGRNLFGIAIIDEDKKVEESDLIKVIK